MAVISVLAQIIAVVSVVAAAWAFWASRNSPLRLLELNGEAISEHRHPRWRAGPKEYCFLGLIALGLGVIIGGGVYGALFLLPFGNDSSLRPTLAAVAAVVGAPFAIQYLMGVAKITLRTI